MNANRTDLVLLMDRSGSMESIRQDMEGAMWALLKDQQIQPGHLVVSLYRFDTEFEQVFTALPVSAVKPIKLKPRGSTALLDAAAMSIDDTGVRLAAMPEADRPGKVIFVIVTDGEENSSQRHTYADVAARIGLQEKSYGWQFIFLGANIDAVATAAQMGIAADNAMTFAPIGPAARLAVDALSAGISRKRSAASMYEAPAFRAADRKKQSEHGAKH